MLVSLFKISEDVTRDKTSILVKHSVDHKLYYPTSKTPSEKKKITFSFFFLEIQFWSANHDEIKK